MKISINRSLPVKRSIYVLVVVPRIALVAARLDWYVM